MLMGPLSFIIIIILVANVIRFYQGFREHTKSYVDDDISWIAETSPPIFSDYCHLLYSVPAILLMSLDHMSNRFPIAVSIA